MKKLFIAQIYLFLSQLDVMPDGALYAGMTSNSDTPRAIGRNFSKDFETTGDKFS